MTIKDLVDSVSATIARNKKNHPIAEIVDFFTDPVLHEYTLTIHQLEKALATSSEETMLTALVACLDQRFIRVEGTYAAPDVNPQAPANLVCARIANSIITQLPTAEQLSKEEKSAIENRLNRFVPIEKKIHKSYLETATLRDRVASTSVSASVSKMGHIDKAALILRCVRLTDEKVLQEVKMADRQVALAQAELYRRQLESREAEYKFSVFGKPIAVGYSKQQKLVAVIAWQEFLVSGSDMEDLCKYLEENYKETAKEIYGALNDWGYFKNSALYELVQQTVDLKTVAPKP